MNKERSDMDIETVKQKIEDSQRSENLLGEEEVKDAILKKAPSSLL